MIISTRDGIARLDQDIERLEQEIGRLRKQRDVLADAQDVLALLSNKASFPDSNSVSNSVSNSEAGTTPKREKRPSRRDTVMAYIEEHGPSKRARLVEATGIPKGTISYLLNDKTRFKRVEDGTWDLKREDAGLPLDQNDSPAQSGA